MNFTEALKLFKSDSIRELTSTEEGIRFLKLRSLNRKETLISLARSIGIEDEDRASILFEILYNEIKLTKDKINKFIREQFILQRNIRKDKEDEIINELYRVETFDWGGLYQNNLEKTLVDNYIKKISSYDKLLNAIENQISFSVKNYVISSWYNHWSSIIIEDIFKEHSKVIPAIGLVKKIDFFIDNIPFDLKVTYLPEGFLDHIRETQNLPKEINVLKQIAKSNDTPIPNLPAKALRVDLFKKINDLPEINRNSQYMEVIEFRKNLVNKIKSNPKDLIKWLYENQGTRRFDASNRLFLILIDSNEYFNSWQLKRAKKLLVKGINSYLDNFKRRNLYNLEFIWEGDTYETISDAIVIIKES